MTKELIEAMTTSITVLRQALANAALDKMADNARELGLSYEQTAQQEPVLQDIEQYRLQMAAISTAALGYWKKGDGIHPDYDTVALHDVADLYAKYYELFKQKAEQPAQQEENLYAYAGVKIWVGNTQASHFISRTAIEHEAIKGMCLHTAADWCLQELKERT